MNPKSNNLKRNLESEIDQLGDMLDAKLAKGDDEYYEASKSYRKEQKEEEQAPKSKRRRGKRM
ncbi:MAG: hypothetical protein OJF59_001824 [Cytophagales bacterium]|jgi:hypothetical protein|nr:hypothetical protein [Bacteroidota bacterium]MBS1950706.1 hypothetical protein [Bacteroidota bacterium]MBS1980734.1 hypothetical protein [Bacteroidota bacterium]WHZ08071.1 MAG: hypothetical protein OJF59_001824 [Cytophagales bacterium]